MNYPHQLKRTLEADRESTNDTQEPLSLSVQQWNESVETFFSNPQLDTLSSSEDASDTVLEDVAYLLQSRILSAVVDSCSRSAAAEADIDTDFVAAVESDASANTAAKQAADIAKNYFESITDKHQLHLISELLRASKNMLRLHMQVLSPQQLGSPQQLVRLYQNGMLQLYLEILQKNQPDPARHASLSLFYCTYNPTNDETIQTREVYLIDTLDFLTVLMELLLQKRPTNLVLSLVRHVHNLVASVPESKQQMDVILMQLWANKAEKGFTAPWSHGNWDSLSLLLVCISSMCLHSEPPFPGEASDRRADLVLECLRVLFVLRAGTSIMDSPDEEDGSFKRLVCEILVLNKNDDPRAYACKLATVSLLMDAPASFSDDLVSCNCIKSLLRILELQVSTVVDQSIYGNQAATELTPILVVLNKFAGANKTVLQEIKDFIFPPDSEEAFQKLSAAEKQKASSKSNNGIGAKNMSPLDAPKGTLRWKLTRLMTWTESHTKRLTSELLWTVCGGDAQEFVLRTGFGNAMPLLACKGLVAMPAGMQS